MSILNIFLIVGVIVVVVIMGMVIPDFVVNVQASSRQYNAKFLSRQISAGAGKVKRAVYGTLHQHLVFFFTLVLCTLFDPVEGVFAPGSSGDLKAAVGTCTYSGGCTGGCLGETADGSCPVFAAQNGNGVIGDWDVSKITSMFESTFATN